MMSSLAPIAKFAFAGAASAFVMEKNLRDVTAFYALAAGINVLANAIINSLFSSTLKDRKDRYQFNAVVKLFRACLSGYSSYQLIQLFCKKVSLTPHMIGKTIPVVASLFVIWNNIPE